MSIVGLPLILFKTLLGGDMGDILDLAIKDFQGKRVDVDTDTTITADATETTIATQTASGGSDMWLAEAKVYWHVVSTQGSVVMDMSHKLYVNNVLKETVDYNRMLQTGSAEGGQLITKFLEKGLRVTTGQEIKITATNGTGGAADTTNHNGILILWEEDSGLTPQITSI